MDVAQRIRELEEELVELKKKLKTENNEVEHKESDVPFNRCALNNEEISRYSRQVILPEIGVKGQVLLKAAKVLVVGAGGLGCPVSQYLTAAGVGTIGIVDYDVVEASNLQRQILHKETNVGLSKVNSAILELKRLNSLVNFNRHSLPLSSKNAMPIIQQYDIVLDCTDNVATRYLLNDACVLLNKPLVSGSALRFEGQLTVYHHEEGPCYRCLYPTPPPAESVTNCSDGGVIGAVTGVIGSMQALEAIKIVCNVQSSFSGALLLFDGLRGTFRKISLRKKKDTCSVCGLTPSIHQLIDYEQFCGSQPTDKELSLNILESASRINVKEYAEKRLSDTAHLLVDVRSKEEFEICNLPDSINVPIKNIIREKVPDCVEEALAKNKEVYFVCRRGNDSQIAVRHVTQTVQSQTVKDIAGGFTSWNKLVDQNFPVY